MVMLTSISNRLVWRPSSNIDKTWQELSVQNRNQGARLSDVRRSCDTQSSLRELQVLESTLFKQLEIRSSTSNCLKVSANTISNENTIREYQLYASHKHWTKNILEYWRSRSRTACSNEIIWHLRAQCI